MRALLDELLLHEELALVFTLVSVATFVGSLLAVPWLIARAPRDLFLRDPDAGRPPRPLAWLLIRNLAGGALLCAGLVMLVLPGQGVLTIIVGLALMTLPGKHALLIRLAKRPRVLVALNYVRRRANREPFDAP